MRKRHSTRIPQVREAVNVYLDHRQGQAISLKTLRYEQRAPAPLVNGSGTSPTALAATLTVPASRGWTWGLKPANVDGSLEKKSNNTYKWVNRK